MTQPNPTETVANGLSRRVKEAKSRAVKRAERATDPQSLTAQSAIGVVKEHPLIALGGAIAIGVVIAQMLPGKVGKGSRKRSRRALDLAATAAEFALAFGKRASDVAGDSGRDGAIRLGHAGHEFGEKMTDSFNNLTRELGGRLGDTSELAQKHGTELAETATVLAREATTLAARKLRELAAKLES